MIHAFAAAMWSQANTYLQIIAFQKLKNDFTNCNAPAARLRGLLMVS